MAGPGGRPSSAHSPVVPHAQEGAKLTEVSQTFPGAVTPAPGLGGAPGNAELFLWELRLSTCHFPGLIGDLHNFLP